MKQIKLICRLYLWIYLNQGKLTICYSSSRAYSISHRNAEQVTLSTTKLRQNKEKNKNSEFWNDNNEYPPASWRETKFNLLSSNPSPLWNFLGLWPPPPQPPGISNSLRCGSLDIFWNHTIGLLLLTVTEVSTTCAVVIFRVKVSCIMSVDGIILWLLILLHWSITLRCYWLSVS